VFGSLKLNTVEFDRFREEALKSVRSWVNEDDINSIIDDRLREILVQKSEISPEPHPIAEVLDSHEIEYISVAVVEELKSLPSKYEVRFPLPYFGKIHEEIRLSDHVRIVPSTFPSQGLDRTPGAMLSVSGVGFAKSSRRQSAIKEAISYVKVACELGTTHRLLRRDKRQMFSIGPAHFAADPTLHLAFERVGSEVGPTLIPLGSSMSHYLSTLRLQYEITDEQFPKVLANVVKIANVMYEPAAQANVRSLRRALEWSFDAALEEDETTQFIKICIGLEAVLAEQAPGVGVTEQLADRGAFLLSRTATSREDTRKEIRKIYSLRSKIVHGNVNGLTHDDERTVLMASTILDAVLTLEIDAVVSWWGRRRS
jgi:hypothetical protein